MTTHWVTVEPVGCSNSSHLHAYDLAISSDFCSLLTFANTARMSPPASIDKLLFLPLHIFPGYITTWVSLPAEMAKWWLRIVCDSHHFCRNQWLSYINRIWCLNFELYSWNIRRYISQQLSKVHIVWIFSSLYILIPLSHNTYSRHPSYFPTNRLHYRMVQSPTMVIAFSSTVAFCLQSISAQNCVVQKSI